MLIQFPPHFRVNEEVLNALRKQSPIVALESAVITHGLPKPVNTELAVKMESILRERNVTPATVALLDGKICIGLDNQDLETLENASTLKVSVRNIGAGIAQKSSGGTTVAATLFAARSAGIHVFATGGIGGVHRGSNFDISADLEELAKRPVVVVCAGAKAILDLPATLEALETRGVPVIGYRTDHFPAFYSRSSRLKVDLRVDSPSQIAKIAKAHWDSGLRSAVLVCQAIEETHAIPEDVIETAVDKATAIAEENGIHGPALTPFLLEKVSQFTEGKSLAANLALLENNARLAAEIALNMGKPKSVNF